MESNTVPIQAPGGVPVMPLHFGRRPRASAPYPFSTRQYVQLLVLRSRIGAGLFGVDDCSAV